MSIPFIVEFKPSKDNQLADALSRMYENEIENVSEGSCDANQLEAKEVNCTNELINTKRSGKSKSVKAPHKPFSRRPKVAKPRVVHKENVFQLINEIPLAFKDLSKYQQGDPECHNIIKSIENKTNHLGF